MAKINSVHRPSSINATKDGLKDGTVSDPNRSFDPGIIQCKEGDGNDCLTAPQVEAMRQVYDGAKNPRTGEQILAGFQPGSEQQLMALIGGKEPFPAASSYFRDVVFNNPQWDYKSFDYDKDLAAAYNIGREILDVPSDGLSKFFKNGGKLLLSHGWSDGLIPAGGTVVFYKSMTAKMDPKTAEYAVCNRPMGRNGESSGTHHCNQPTESKTDVSPHLPLSADCQIQGFGQHG
jgi:hypothetical protein